MNSKDKNPDYKGIYSAVKRLFYKTRHFRHGPFDETYYTLRVFESAKEILKALNKKANREEILAAAILHDVGKTRLDCSLIFGDNKILDGAKKEWHRHTKLGIPIARRILKRHGHSEEFINNVCFLIENHAERGNKLKNQSLELKVLQDADLIADCGFAGFIRPFLYSGKFSHAPVINSIRYIQNKKDRVEETNSLNLRESRKIASRKIKLQKQLVNDIAEDLDSELLE